MDSVRGYLALSLFWLAMIPSRFLCGCFAKYRSHLIYIAPLGAAITAATGIGATVISASFGFLHEQFGFTGAFLILAALLAFDILIAAMVPRLKR